jgi:hypothetical protein
MPALSVQGALVTAVIFFYIIHSTRPSAEDGGDDTTRLSRHLHPLTNLQLWSIIALLPPPALAEVAILHLFDLVQNRLQDVEHHPSDRWR